MNKTIINKSLICAMVLAATLPLVAATETVDGITWTYTVANGVVSVGAGSQSSPAVPVDTSGTITIPSLLGDCRVTSIGSYAFYNCTNLASVTIPNEVTSIASYAFGNCSGLTSVTVPNSVMVISSYAFSVVAGLLKSPCHLSGIGATSRE